MGIEGSKVRVGWVGSSGRHEGIMRGRREERYRGWQAIAVKVRSAAGLAS